MILISFQGNLRDETIYRIRFKMSRSLVDERLEETLGIASLVMGNQCDQSLSFKNPWGVFKEIVALVSTLSEPDPIPSNVYPIDKKRLWTLLDDYLNQAIRFRFHVPL